jgi:5-methyltetrahydrofolate--homocysteine methyltransferase
VKGDLHDIGKNLVGMMLEGGGFEVIDIGIDAPPEKFIKAVKDHEPKIVGLSALLTTTMTQMKVTIEALRGIRLGSQTRTIVGGAPVTEEFARQIGADGYAPDAVMAVEKVRELIGLN